MAILIRKATVEERDGVARLMHQSDPWVTLGITFEQCKRSCTDPAFEVYVSLENNEVSGAILLDPAGVAGAPYIKTVVVDEKYRSQGVGKSLIDFAEDHYRNTSKHLFLCVSSFNKRAIEFYRKNGYRELTELKDHIVDGFSELLYYKRLR